MNPAPAPAPHAPYRRLLPVLLFAAALATAGLGCGGGEPAPGAGEAQAAQGGGHPGPKGGKEKPSEPPVPVAVATAFVGDIASHYSTTATLEAEARAEVLARVAGVVESIPREEGDWVAAGAELLRIENDEYRLRMEQAVARTANLRSAFQRSKEMFGANLVSAEAFDAAKNDLTAAESDEGLARLSLSYTSVTAPFEGRIVSRMVDVGQTVNVGTPLFALADFTPLLARVHVPSRELGKLQADQPVQLVLDSDKERLTGRIKLVSPVIDPMSGTIKLTVEVPDYPEGTRPGDFAEIHIVTERRLGRTLAPKIAVLTDKGDEVVYVAVDGTAERRVVQVGFTDDDNAEIVSGVEPGEVVVVKGQRSLKHGSPIKILEGADPAQPSRIAADA